MIGIYYRPEMAPRARMTSVLPYAQKPVASGTIVVIAPRIAGPAVDSFAADR